MCVCVFQSAGADPVELQRQQDARRRAQAKRRVQQQLQRVRTPDPVEGRQHVDVQTELYLEELSDRVEEADVECQTDAFLDRPPTPLFIPAKTGVDCETQILDGEVSIQINLTQIGIFNVAEMTGVITKSAEAKLICE